MDQLTHHLPAVLGSLVGSYLAARKYVVALVKTIKHVVERQDALERWAIAHGYQPPEGGDLLAIATQVADRKD